MGFKLSPKEIAVVEAIMDQQGIGPDSLVKVGERMTNLLQGVLGKLEDAKEFLRPLLGTSGYADALNTGAPLADSLNGNATGFAASWGVVKGLMNDFNREISDIEAVIGLCQYFVLLGENYEPDPSVQSVRIFSTTAKSASGGALYGELRQEYNVGEIAKDVGGLISSFSSVLDTLENAIEVWGELERNPTVQQAIFKPVDDVGGKIATAIDVLADVQTQAIAEQAQRSLRALRGY